MRRRKGALVVADGFSCRTQIAQGTGRRALHLAEVLRLAQERVPPADPERWARGRAPRPDPALRAARTAAAVLLGGAAWLLARRARA